MSSSTVVLLYYISVGFFFHRAVLPCWLLCVGVSCVTVSACQKSFFVTLYNELRWGGGEAQTDARWNWSEQGGFVLCNSRVLYRVLDGTPRSPCVRRYYGFFFRACIMRALARMRKHINYGTYTVLIYTCIYLMNAIYRAQRWA